MSTFSYEEAFSRNIGWVTEREQRTLRSKTVAIAGMGGVGGVHLLTLARLGIGRFHIADFDRFELANFNRQVGASMATLGRPKVDVLAEMALEIDPELRIERFAEGVTDENVDAFLEGVDLFIDGLDFFVLDLRARLFARCAARGIPAITAAPIGLGTAFLVFMPGGMTFEEYFRFDGLKREEKALSFLVGLTPRAFQRGSLVDPSRVNLLGGRGPSTVIACQLCAGVAAAEALKILLRRGPVRSAPRYHQFDPYHGKWTIGWLPGGNRNPLQRLRRSIARAALGRLSRNPPPAAPLPSDAPVLEQILHLARWAPSGDNLQPWRFETLSSGEDGERLRIHIARAERPDVYDYNDGEPTLLSIGTLLESLRIAATRFERRTEWNAEHLGAVEVRFRRDASVIEDPLAAELTSRSVDRRRYRATPLTAGQKAALAAALGGEFQVTWFETPAERWKMTKLNARGTEIRLRIPEAFAVHQRIIDWERDYSPDGVPARSVGLAAPSLAMMRVMMRDWRRMQAANRFLGGTLLARLEMDVLPGLGCAAHFAISAKDHSEAAEKGRDLEHMLLTGAAVQRFWLTAATLGLAMQPNLATICFASYGRQRTPFTADTRVQEMAVRLSAELDDWTAARCTSPVLFLGRIGIPRSAGVPARSVRRPIDELVKRDAAPPRTAEQGAAAL
jgi:nitroreductase